MADRATCSTSEVNYIRCSLQQPSGQQDLAYITSLQLRWEDGSRQTLCVGSKSKRGSKARRNSSKPVSGKSYKTIELAAGDGIFGIRACYDSTQQHVVGLMFSATSGQHVCGNVWRYPKTCFTSRTLAAAPLSHIEATCDSGTFTGINKVCWNRYYTPRQLHYGEQLWLSAGASRSLIHMYAAAEYCLPCSSAQSDANILHHPTMLIKM